MSDAAGEVVITERQGPVLTVTMNRPKVLNVLDEAMADALVAAFSGLAADQTIRAVVLAGAGRSFMAGGDFALIKSVESFEDRVDYGVRQLMELGLGPHDLLIASTEGGETPFVIGAANQAAKVSSRAPYFLYCNPDEVLMSIQRSREVIEDRNIIKINLSVGPMAISGSTRMQASTVLMLGIGVGLLYKHASRKDFGAFYQDLLERLGQVAYRDFAPLTKNEAEVYQQGRYVNYVSDPALAISILTDTTERAPTFSLSGFENRLDERKIHSLSYMFVAGSENSDSAWNQMLMRSPRPLAWTDLNGRIDMDKVLGFDISPRGQDQRSLEVGTGTFRIFQVGGTVNFCVGGDLVRYYLGQDGLFTHLMVKMLMNAHSTALMGLLGRYEGNVMTYVRPSNNKLIDRAARYAIQLLDDRGVQTSYESVVHEIFEQIEKEDSLPVVLRVLNQVLDRSVMLA